MRTILNDGGTHTIPITDDAPREKLWRVRCERCRDFLQIGKNIITPHGYRMVQSHGICELCLAKEPLED